MRAQESDWEIQELQEVCVCECVFVFVCVCVFVYVCVCVFVGVHATSQVVAAKNDVIAHLMKSQVKLLMCSCVCVRLSRAIFQQNIQ